MTAPYSAINFNAASAGVANFVVASAGPNGVVPESALVIDGKTYTYYAETADGLTWESGTGAYTISSHTLARTSITANSNGDLNAVNFLTVPIVSVFASPVATLETETDFVPYGKAVALTINQKAQGRANIGVEKKNYILNGAMLVSQENGSTAGTTNQFYAVDQFLAGINNGGTCSVQQVTSATPAGSSSRFRYTVTAADASVAATDFAYILTRLEGFRIVDLQQGSASAKQMVLQFGVKAPAGTYSVVVANGGGLRSYVAEYTVPVSNVDTLISVLIPGDVAGSWFTDSRIGISVVWGLMTGSNSAKAAGAWGNDGASVFGSLNQFNLMGTNGNVFELFDVGLYEGSVAPAFVVPDYLETLLECRRYWMQFGSGVAASILLQGTSTVASGAIGQTVPLPVPMRAIPTVATVGAFTNVNAGTVSFFASAVSLSIQIIATAAGQTSWFNTNGSAYLALNARM